MSKPERHLPAITILVVLAMAFGGALWAASKAREGGQKSEELSVTFEGGKLVYHPDAQGNVVPDFSMCGYMGGGVAIPNVAVKVTVNPEGGADDTARLQAAIDQVSALPEGPDGFRGALLLTKGLYRVGGSLSVRTGGVVIRGQGQDDGGTVILATGTKKRNLLQFSGKGSRGARGDSSKIAIADDYVPFGAKSFTVESAAGLAGGDKVVVERPGSDKWIHDLKMDRIPSKGNTVQWRGEGYRFHFERTVKKIEGNRVTLDAPLVNSLDRKYGGGFLYKSETSRISKVGVEDILFVSEYKKGRETKDEDHANTAVDLGTVENGWARRVSSRYFIYSCVTVSSGAKFVTVEDCACIDPVSEITGGRRYSFGIAGQFTLVQRCYARNGRHDYVMSARVPGPNVFLDCLAEKTHSDIGPHHRWSMGTLFDNITGGQMDVQDRGSMGSGHGWAGAQTLYWNCDAKSMVVESPPTATNWAIGCITPSRKGDGRWESPGQHVAPRSLYLQQLEERLGPPAVRLVATDEQLRGTIHDTLKKHGRVKEYADLPR